MPWARPSDQDDPAHGLGCIVEELTDGAKVTNEVQTGSNLLASATHRVDLGASIAEVAPTLLASARLVLPEPEAWDVVAITMEIALRHQGSLRDPSAIRSWLLVIQGREIFRLRRRLGRFVALDSVELASDDGAGATIERLDVRAALASLPVRMRAAVVLRHMAGLPVADVARAMNVSENTVKSELRVGLARLREVLRYE